jgi:hypothetical protein
LAKKKTTRRGGDVPSNVSAPPAETEELPKSMKYLLEVYKPGSARDAVLLMQSSEPFMSIRPGDLLNPRTWDSRRWPACQDLVGKLLTVVRVEHAIWEVGETVAHKLMVYTEAVADYREARRGFLH